MTGELLQASSRRKKIDAVRKFFQDLQAWEWIPRRFNAGQSLTAPAYLHAQIGPNPRIIASDIWAKLLQAALNLTEADIQPLATSGAKIPAHPLEMVRAVALIWVFGGLRNDEIRRLRVGCIRLEDEASVEAQPTATLRVPANKTSGRFEKPISHLAAKALLQWQALRPKTPPLLDSKTGELCHFLFVYRGRRLGQSYINKHLIPMLCTKADVPLSDAKGRITSHRARATMSNALVTGDNAMSLLELQRWLGHSMISSTMHYVRPTLTRLADTYADTDYFERNLRLIDVLVDQDAIHNGATDHWLHYDLGHGYCNNDFFVHCAHRMACARCTFYLPKDSTQAQLLEAKGHLRHMMQSIELTDAEVAAVSGDLEALENLLQSLQSVSTPDGQTQEVST
jgi:integrase